MVSVGQFNFLLSTYVYSLLAVSELLKTRITLIGRCFSTENHRRPTSASGNDTNNLYVLPLQCIPDRILKCYFCAGLLLIGLLEGFRFLVEIKSWNLESGHNLNLSNVCNLLWTQVISCSYHRFLDTEFWCSKFWT